MVGDTLDGARGARPRGARARAQANIVAVTGSVGKTGTKEVLRRALGAPGPRPTPSLAASTIIGACRCRWRACRRDADYGVFELGMNHAGEIDAAGAHWSGPHVAVITTIEPAHLGLLRLGRGDRRRQGRDLQRAWSPAAPPSSTATTRISRGSPTPRRRAASAASWPSAATQDADVRLIDCALHADGSAVTAAVMGDDHRLFASACRAGTGR